MPCWPLDGAVMAVSIGLMCGKPQDKVAAYCISVCLLRSRHFRLRTYELITGRGGAMWVFMGAWIARTRLLTESGRRAHRRTRSHARTRAARPAEVRKCVVNRPAGAGRRSRVAAATCEGQCYYVAPRWPRGGPAALAAKRRRRLSRGSRRGRAAAVWSTRLK